MDLGLRGRVVLVSGGYRGTGAGTAKVLAAEGALVAVHGFELAQADEVVAEITAANGQAAAVDGSLSDEAGVERVVGQVEEAFGPVEILVNNYGAPGRTGWESAADEWYDGWDRNVLTAVRLTQRVLPAMRAAGFGRVVFLGTIGTRRPGAQNPDYYGAKGALPVLVRSLAKELRGTGVTANLVSPGMIATAEVRASIERRAAREGVDGWAAAQRWALDNSMPNLTEQIPEPEDIGRFVAFVASDAAWHMTGVDLQVDGGAIDA